MKTITKTLLILAGILSLASGQIIKTSGTPTIGVIVTKSNGTRTAYPPSADTDAARGLALEAAFAAAVAGDTIDLSPGNYLVAKATSTVIAVATHYQILARMTLRLNGARLYHETAFNAAVMFGADAVDDWSIIGPGIIEGTGTASTTPPSGASEIGINNRTCRRFRIENVTVRYFKGTGLQGNTSSYTDHGTTLAANLKISTAHIHGCNFDYNNKGAGIYQSTEFWQFTNCTFNNNATGATFTAANSKFVGCDACGNSTDAVIISNNGAQDGHGCWIGGHIVHNVLRAIHAPASMDLGFLFIGVTIAGDSSTTNQIISLGSGLTFSGCYIDAPFYAASTPTGINTVKNCFFSLAGVSAAAAIADLSAAERAQWKFQNNHTTTGVWANDDIRTTYADDTAAGVGGVLQGEPWQQTTTGAMFIKL